MDRALAAAVGVPYVRDMPSPHTRALSLAFLAFGLSGSPCAAQPRPSEEAAIRAARAHSNHAIAAHDVEGVVSVMASEYFGLSSGNSRSVGRDAARESYAHIFASRPGVVFVRTPRAITVNPQWHQAGELGTWTGRWSSIDGNVRVGGSYFAKWNKVSGQWKLLAETFVQTTCAGTSYCVAPPVSASSPAGSDPLTVQGLSHVFAAVDSATFATFAATAASMLGRDVLGAFDTRTPTRRRRAALAPRLT